MSDATQEQVSAAIATVPGWTQSRVEVRPIVGGLSNSNWLVRRDGRDYFLKMFRPGSELFINRDVADLAARRASDMCISPKVVHFDATRGFEISEYLEGFRASTNADFQRTDFLQSAIDLYRRFNSGERLPYTKHIFDMVDEHIEQCTALKVLWPSDIEWLLAQYQRAKSAFFASGLDLAPCHNDAMPGNFMVALNGGDQIESMKMIDFEFASNNERAYEIGIFLGEVFADEIPTVEMIERYYGASRPELIARVWVARAVADVKWGCWGLQQRKLSDWDFDYQKYGIWKFGRARALFNDARWNLWLSQV